MYEYLHVITNIELTLCLEHSKNFDGSSIFPNSYSTSIRNHFIILFSAASNGSSRSVRGRICRKSKWWLICIFRLYLCKNHTLIEIPFGHLVIVELNDFEYLYIDHASLLILVRINHQLFRQDK